VVGAAFSLAASLLFPALALGVFWKRANHIGAMAGMLTGFLVCVFYMLHTNPILGGSAAAQWFHIAPISAGVFGVPAGMLALVVGSLLTRAPDPATQGLLAHLRGPE
jgi:cation/acetate symporter